VAHGGFFEVGPVPKHAFGRKIGEVKVFEIFDGTVEGVWWAPKEALLHVLVNLKYVLVVYAVVSLNQL